MQQIVDFFNAHIQATERGMRVDWLNVARDMAVMAAKAVDEAKQREQADKPAPLPEPPI